MSLICAAVLPLQIPPGRGVGGAGPEFDLPVPFTSDEVAPRMRDRFQWPRGPRFQTAKAWLKTAGFTAKQAPALILYWWSQGVAGLHNLFDRLMYDPLHCIDIGLIDYFMDAIVCIIPNSWPTKEQGAKALARFESRLGSIPAFNTGFRLFRA